MTRLAVRLLRSLVALAADPQARAAVIADFDEEFAQRQAADGSPSALRWYRSQAIRSLLPLTRRRLDVFMSGHRSLVRLGNVAALRPQIVRAARGLSRAPAFTLITVATLALGIGVSTATFTAVSAALLQPLPYPTHARLAVLEEVRGDSPISVSYPDFLDWQSRGTAFDAMAAFRSYATTLTDGGTPERIRGQVVTSGLFAVLGVQPVLGRAFNRDVDEPGGPSLVLLSDGLWRRRFGADPNIVGTFIHLDGVRFEVTGVMPSMFRFPDGIVYSGAPDAYVPIGPFIDADLRNRDSHAGLEVIGLLHPGVALERARDEMGRLQQQVAREHPNTNQRIGVRLSDAVALIVGDLGSQLSTVWGASLLLLLIACANVASLTLTRALSKRRELALRTALGASRRSLAATLLAEQVIVAAAGTVAGIALAFGLTTMARHYVADLPRLAGLQPDGRALAFAVGLMVLTTVVCSVAPMAWLGRASLDPWLRERGQTRGGWRLRRTLVGLQLALALTLVSIAGLLGMSIGELARRTGGISPTNVLTFDLRLPNRRYERDAMAPFYRDLYDRLRSGPHVSAVGGISVLPFTGSGAQSGVRLRNAPPASEIRTDVAVVTPDYFRAMGVALVRGRGFDDRDGVSTAPVAIVDERFAARAWPGRSPIGEHLAGWGFDDLTVIGVAGHVDSYGVGAQSREELYVPYAQRPTPRLFTAIRAEGDVTALTAYVRDSVRAVDPSLAVANVQTMDTVVGQTVAGQQLAAVLSIGFAALAMMLASVGIYGLVAYAVELRRREAGIRLALGAAPASVVRLMAASVAAALAIGAGSGLVGALLVGRLVRSQLFNVRPYEPSVLLASTAALVAVATVATWLPARRIAKVSPAIALQLE